MANSSLVVARLVGYKGCQRGWLHKLTVEVHGRRGLVMVERCSPMDITHCVSLPAKSSELLGKIVAHYKGGEEWWA